MAVADDVRHAVEVRIRHGGAGGEAEAVVEEVLADGAAAHATAAKDGLQVHRFPDGAGFDVLGFQGKADLFVGGAKLFGVDQNNRQPTVAAAIGGLGHEGDAGEVAEEFLVGGENLAFALDALVEDAQLATSDRGHDVAHPVIVAYLGVFVVRGSVGVSREATDTNLRRNKAE